MFAARPALPLRAARWPRRLAAASLCLALSPVSQAMTPLPELELARTQAAGLDEAVLRGLTQAPGQALPVAEPGSPVGVNLAGLNQGANAALQRQAAQFHQQAGEIGAQLVLNSAVLGTSLVFMPALPLMLPVIGLPLLGLLPMLPPPKQH